MGPFGETWEINEPGLRIHPWFTTASGNCVFAVNEMLVRGTVPETWKDYAFRLPDGKGRWIDCEVKDGRRVRFHRTGISRVGGCNEIFMQSQRVLAAENAKDTRLMPRSRPASGL